METTENLQADQKQDAATQGQGENKPQARSIGDLVIYFCGGVFLAICYALWSSEGKFLLQLQDASVSRGLITFLVAMVTVAISLLLAAWVIASNAPIAELKERFSHAKDVLATLVGILGTILGFYFGSADKTGVEPLMVAELQIQNSQVVTHVSGGTAPFRFTVTPADGDKKGSFQISKDGWIFVPMPASAKAGTTVTIEAIDAKDKKANKSKTLEPNDVKSEK